MSIKTWQERLDWITSTSYQGYASQEEIDACKQAELDEIRSELARRTGEIEQLTETSINTQENHMAGMKIKTSELTGAALDWAVAKTLGPLGQKPSTCRDCEHHEERAITDSSEHICHFSFMTWTGGGYFDDTPFGDGISVDYGVHQLCPINELTAEPYSTDWAHGGPIIERECITVAIGDWDVDQTPIVQTWSARSLVCEIHAATNDGWLCGPTPLIAAMRCFVASKLGDEVEIPAEIDSEQDNAATRRAIVRAAAEIGKAMK